MRATWYVLEDGTAVPPSEVAPNEKGLLAHKSGLVAMRNDGETPRSRGVDVDESGKQLFAGKGDHDGDDHTGGAAKPPVVPPREAPPAPPEVPKRTTEMRPAKAKPRAKKPGYKTR